MATETVRVTIYEAGIQSHFQFGGAVQKDADKVGRSAVERVKLQLVPGHGFRSGELQRGIQRVGLGAAGRLSYIITIRSNASYGMYVEKGTGDIVLGPKEYRALKPGPGHPHISVLSDRLLRGQEGIHYLRDGVSEALEAHGYGPVVDE